jgi:pimeloyl-ACP methyl ester carboxylesterase
MLQLAGLECEVRGDGDAIPFIHGAIIADSFAPILLEPALARYQRIRYRRRGYGQSVALSDDTTIEQHAADARSLLDALLVQRAHVVAHSGGGPIALQMAMDAPEVVRSLTLLEPALQTAEMAAAFSELIQPLVEMSRAGDRSKAVHLWMRTTGGPDWRTEIESRVPGAAAQAVNDAAGHFEGDLSAMRRWDFNKVDMTHIRQPVLYLVSECNAANVKPVTDMFLAAVPGTELGTIPDADHNMQVIWPDRAANAIAAFLNHRTS